MVDANLYIDAMLVPLIPIVLKLNPYKGLLTFRRTTAGASVCGQARHRKRRVARYMSER